MTLEEAQGPGTDIWPDNVQAVNVFISMATQWRIGPNGVTGLDYNALAFVMRANDVKEADRAAVFDDLRTLEDAALETIRKKKK